VLARIWWLLRVTTAVGLSVATLPPHVVSETRSHATSAAVHHVDLSWELRRGSEAPTFEVPPPSEVMLLPPHIAGASVTPTASATVILSIA